MFKLLASLSLLAVAPPVTGIPLPSPTLPLQDGDESAEEARPTTVRTGKHFRVVCHFESERAADEALASVEALWKPAGRIYKLPKRVDEPLTVHLYRTSEDYVAADRELTGGNFARNLAFAHHDTRTAHVALQPALDDDRLEELGLPLQTRRLLAHEAAHLVRFEAMPNFRSHPEWLVDGAASWLDGEALRGLGIVDELGSAPHFASEVVRVREALAGDDPPTVERIFTGRLDGLGFYERYSVTSLFFRFMEEGKHKKRLGKLIDKARQLGGGPGYAKALMDQVRKTYSEKKMAALDEEFREWVAELEPEWFELYRSLEPRDGGWLQIAFPDTNAMCWRATPVGRTEYCVKGSFEILPTGGQQLNLLLNRSDEGFVSIAFAANYGVTVFDQRRQGNVWNRVATAEVKTLRSLTKLPFEVRVAGKRLAVLLNGEQVVAAELPRELPGAWGLGAQATSIGRWHDVVAE